MKYQEKGLYVYRQFNYDWGDIFCSSCQDQRRKEREEDRSKEFDLFDEFY
jgi:hypothetical protein